MTYGIIYGLYDPRDGKLRYVGQTRQKLNRRVNSHVSSAARQRRLHVYRWILRLRALGLRPSARVICEASSQEELNLLEIREIRLARDRDDPLTNTTEGGQVLVFETTAAQRNHIERLRQMKVGVPRSEETKARISESKKGTVSPKRGMAMSEEQKAKVSASRKGKMTGQTHHQYRHDISTEFILQRLNEGYMKAT